MEVASVYRLHFFPAVVREIDLMSLLETVVGHGPLALVDTSWLAKSNHLEITLTIDAQSYFNSHKQGYLFEGEISTRLSSSIVSVVPASSLLSMLKPFVWIRIDGR